MNKISKVLSRKYLLLKVVLIGLILNKKCLSKKWNGFLIHRRLETNKLVIAK